LNLLSKLFGLFYSSSGFLMSAFKRLPPAAGTLLLRLATGSLVS
jgi:hypothetical protein